MCWTGKWKIKRWGLGELGRSLYDAFSKAKNIHFLRSWNVTGLLEGWTIWFFIKTKRAKTFIYKRLMHGEHFTLDKIENTSRNVRKKGAKYLFIKRNQGSPVRITDFFRSCFHTTHISKLEGNWFTCLPINLFIYCVTLYLHQRAAPLFPNWQHQSRLTPYLLAVEVQIWMGTSHLKWPCRPVEFTTNQLVKTSHFFRV